MNIKKMFHREAIKGKKGVTLVIVAIMIVVLVGIVALAVDVGHLMATRNELQNVADAAALAGAGHLGSVYINLGYSDQQNYNFTRGDIVGVVQAVAEKNKASGESISINDDDIIIGLWDPDTREIAPETLTSPDAVYVKARRDDSANSPISTFFARIFGVDTVSVTAEATAALTGPASAGELKTPFALSELVFPNDCTDTINFSPTTDSCAGWHNFFGPANANNLEEKMLGLIEGHAAHDDCDDCEQLTLGNEWLNENFEIQINQYPDAEVTPETFTGMKFNFIGGNVSSVFLGGVLPLSYNGNTFDKVNDTIIGNEKKPAPFPALFDYFRYRDGDDDNTVWTTTVPVYKEESDSCGNPQGAIEIVGFARIVVKMPNPPPDSTVTVTVDCNFSVIEGRGGGGSYGNLRGSIPSLVK
jgi:Flp pilus assembly protein TadG